MRIRFLNLLYILNWELKKEISVIKDMNNSITTFTREKIEVSYFRLLYILYFLLLAACNNSKQPPASQITSSPEEFHEKSSDLIKRYLEYAISNNGKVNDSIQLSMSSGIKMIYENLASK